MQSRSRRWTFVTIYGLVCASNQMLWLTFAPMTTTAANHYHVSVSDIGWLSEIFPLAYFLLAIPFGHALDKNFKVSLSGGAALNAIGAIVRTLSGSFAIILVGQILIAISQPLLLNAITRVAGEYLDEKDRPNGLALGSASLFLGMLFSLILGSAFSIADIANLIRGEALVATVLVVALVLAVKYIDPLVEQLPIEDGSGARRLLQSGPFLALLGLAAIGFGAFIAITTWLQSILADRGVSANSAGLLLVVMVVSGTVGAGIIPSIVAKRKLERIQLYITTTVTTALCIIVAFVSNYSITMVAMAIGGFLLIGALPTLLDTADRTSSGSSGIATGLVWLAGNGGGLVIALVVQQLVKSPLASFLFLAAMTLVAAFLVPMLPIGRLRSEAVSV
ncbi:MAG: MFS transporter [Acidimicrobiales bacterium]|nr:MFS transporter [Acidimicrobiales bacterium]